MIKIEVLKNSHSSKKKCTALQNLAEWANAVQQWLVIKGIDFVSAETLAVVRFKHKGSALTTYNNFKRDKVKTAILFNFMLVLLDVVIPSSSKDLLWKK